MIPAPHSHFGKRINNIYYDYQEKKRTASGNPKAVLFFNYYSSEIAPTGQLPAHVPQEIHVSGSITYCPSPSEIAPTGQLPAHVPHEIQELSITYAIAFTSLKNSTELLF